MKSSISKLVNSFNKYLNADSKRKRWAVAPRWGVVREKKSKIWERKKEKKTRWLRGEYVEACIHSFFIQVWYYVKKKDS